MTHTKLVQNLRSGDQIVRTVCGDTVWDRVLGVSQESDGVNRESATVTVRTVRGDITYRVSAIVPVV